MVYDPETYEKPIRNRRPRACPQCGDTNKYRERIGYEKCEACGYFVDYHRGVGSDIVAPPQTCPTCGQVAKGGD